MSLLNIDKDINSDNNDTFLGSSSPTAGSKQPEKKRKRKAGRVVEGEDFWS